MVNAMFAVLIAGSIGYVLSGWVGVAVGATVASAVAVLTEALTPPIERGTWHERRMRRDRRYRARYEAIEDSWRRPYPRSRREWQRATQPTGKKPAFAGPAPADPVPLRSTSRSSRRIVPDSNTQGQLPAGSKRPGRSPRAETSSRTSAPPRQAGSRPASRRVEAKVAGASARSMHRLNRGVVLHPRSRLAIGVIRPREVPGRTRHPADPRHRTSQGGGCRPP